MRAPYSAAILLGCLPTPATGVPPAAPPSPPPVLYQVWGYRWDGRQYVKDAPHCLSTTDVKQAADYANEVRRFAGWTATTNVPPAFLLPVYCTWSRFQPPAPTPPAYAVWAFCLEGGKWVPSREYSWSSLDPAMASRYARKVDSVAGWRTTTNLPALPPAAQQTGGNWARRGAANWFLEGPFSVDSSNAIEDSLNVQSMIATQDMVNNQLMNDNIQNMINTQNMVNNQLMNDNIQNMVNQQNMINAMNQ